MPEPNREELIRLVRQIACASACTMDFDALLNRLERQVPHPDVGRLIFDPPGGKPLTPEEIVDAALSWKRPQT